MPTRSAARRRPRVTATLDPDLLASVDAYVADHPELDRSAMIDAALRLWHARELELAQAAQFAAPDGVDPAERQAWNQLRRAAAARPLNPRGLLTGASQDWEQRLGRGLERVGG